MFDTAVDSCFGRTVIASVFNYLDQPDQPARYIDTVQFYTIDSSIRPTKRHCAEGGAHNGKVFSVTS